jgi:hypothetical protein
MKISNIGLIVILLIVIGFSMMGYREGATSNIKTNYINDIIRLYDSNGAQKCTNEQAKNVLGNLSDDFKDLSKSDRANHPFIQDIVNSYTIDKSYSNVYLLLNKSVNNYKTDSNYSKQFKNLSVLSIMSSATVKPVYDAPPPPSVPSSVPSNVPSSVPSNIPSSVPSSVPSGSPSSASGAPSGAPFSAPSGAPSPLPSNTTISPTSYNIAYISKNDIDPLYDPTNRQINTSDPTLAYNTLKKIDSDIQKNPSPGPVLIAIDQDIRKLDPNDNNIYRNSAAILNKGIAILEPTASRPPIILPANYK